MMIKKSLLVVVLAMCSVAMAVDTYYYYQTPASNQLWSDGANWLKNGATTGETPGPGDGVTHVGWGSNPEVCNIVSGDDITVSYVWFGSSTAGLTTTLNMSGTGKLTTEGDFLLAYSDDTTNATLNISDDAILTCGGGFNVSTGNGTLNMSGNAQLNATMLWNTLWQAGAVSHLNIGGNSVVTATNTDWSGFYWGNIDDVGTGGAYYSDPHMDLTENGKVVIATENKDYALGVIADGRFTAECLGLSNFLITDDSVTGMTTFEVIPEPMTLALLGLGGLFLRSRKS